jgi:hypothetical protein
MGGSSAPAVHLSAAAPTEKDTPCAASCPREVSGRPAGAARTRSVHGVGVRRAAPGPRNGWNECTWRSLRAGFGSPRLPTAATPRPTPRRRPTSCPDEFGGSPRTPNLNGGGYQRPHAPPPHPARACGSRWYSTDTSTPLQTAIHRSGTVFKASGTCKGTRELLGRGPGPQKRNRYGCTWRVCAQGSQLGVALRIIQ